MSKDIRSFFNVVSKKSVASNSSNEPQVKKKTKRLIDSDDEDIVEATPEKTKPSKAVTTKRKQPESKQQPSTAKPNLKPVNIDEIFTNIPVKQTKVEKKQGVEYKPIEEPKKANSKSKSKKKKHTKESSVHEDVDFEKTLIDLDDDLFTENIDVLDRTIDEALTTNKTGTDEPKQGSSKENSPNKPKDKELSEENKNKRHRDSLKGEIEHTPKKRKFNEDSPKKPKPEPTPKKTNTEKTPNKTKLEHTDSGIDPDQEKYEKKRYSAMLYQKYQQRAGPKLHGQKEYPKGNPDCLKNLTFLRTGVLDSLEGDEFTNLVVEHGGRLVKAVSKKVDYMVVGEEPGPAKLEKSRGLNIPEISEDEFLDLILVKSGKKARYVIKSQDSVESGMFVDDSPKKDKTKKEESSHSSKEKLSHSSKNEEVTDKINLKKLLLKDMDSSEGKESKQKQDSHEEGKKRKIEKIESTTKYENNTKSFEIDKSKSTKSSADDIDRAIKKEKVESSSAPSKLSLTWTEKYKPQNLKTIIGQQGDSSNANKLKNWLTNWYRNQQIPNKKRPSPWDKNNDGSYYKAALLSGSPGVGKTTTATLVSKELGFDIVEFNASDTRSKKLLEQEVAQLLNNTTIAGFAEGRKIHNDKKRVLLMDEVDGMAGNEDRGGIRELITLIQNTNIPIICMCNDRNHPKIRSLVNYCYDLRFTKPNLNQIKGAMMSICFKEGLEISPAVLTEIIAGTGGDIRQTLNNLTMYAAAKDNNSLEETKTKSKESKKDTVLGPWEVVRAVFSESEHKNMSFYDKSKLFFYDYSLGPLFIQENYLNVTPDCPPEKRLKRAMLAADAISVGDLIDTKIRTTNNWSLLESQAIYSSVLPGYYMSGKITSSINFPGWLGKNSSAFKKKRLVNELYAHTCTSTSGNVMAMKLDYVVPLRDAIVKPLIKDGVDGIQESIKVMQSYNLLREDLNSLVELCQWKDSTNLFDKVDTKVKTAFTKAYNKVAPRLPFTPKVGFSKKKGGGVDEDLENDEDLVESDVEEDDVATDSLIKVKTKTKDKASTSKASSSKGKGKETKKSSKGKAKKS